MLQPRVSESHWLQLCQCVQHLPARLPVLSVRSPWYEICGCGGSIRVIRVHTCVVGGLSKEEPDTDSCRRSWISAVFLVPLWHIGVICPQQSRPHSSLVLPHGWTWKRRQKKQPWHFHLAHQPGTMECFLNPLGLFHISICYKAHREHLEKEWHEKAFTAVTQSW